MNPTRAESVSEEVLRARNRVLAELARGVSLEDVLALLVRSAEEIVTGLRCSILLLEGERLFVAAAPSLPESYNQAIDGLTIGPTMGSCGAAAHSGERVVASDVLTHPNWAPFRDLAREAGFRSSWSEPIRSPDGVVLGTFAMYHDEPKEPTPFELEFIHSTAQVAGVWIERKRNEEALQRARDELEERVRERTESLTRALERLEDEVRERSTVEDELRESEQLFRQLTENINEVFWLENADLSRILYVSPAYERVWQRKAEDLYADPREWLMAIHEEDRPEVERNFYSLCVYGEFDQEYRIVRPDGTIRWIRDRGFRVLDENGDVVRIAGCAQDITQSKLAEQEIVRHQEQLRTLASELVVAEERERRRLAVDLHDGLNQTITLAQMKLAALRGSAEGELGDRLEEIERLIEQANGSARSLTFQLSPPVLHDLGLEPAVQWLVEDFRGTYGIDVRLEERADELPLDERVRVILFRAVRELLINVAKHARARRTLVRIRREGDEVRIEVEDDGRSFEVGDPGSAELGFGLFGIRERLSYIGGRMEIEQPSAGGTIVRLWAPVELAEDEEGDGTPQAAERREA